MKIKFLQITPLAHACGQATEHGAAAACGAKPAHLPNTIERFASCVCRWKKYTPYMYRVIQNKRKKYNMSVHASRLPPNGLRVAGGTDEKKTGAGVVRRLKHTRQRSKRNQIAPLS